MKNEPTLPPAPVAAAQKVEVPALIREMLSHADTVTEKATVLHLRSLDVEPIAAGEAPICRQCKQPYDWNAAVNAYEHDDPCMPARRFPNPCMESCQYLLLDDEIQKLRRLNVELINKSEPQQHIGEKDAPLIQEMLAVLKRAQQFIARVDDLRQTIYSNGLDEDCEEVIKKAEESLKSLDSVEEGEER